MSFDVEVGEQDFNYTSNMGQFFSDFGVHPVNHFNGVSRSGVSQMILTAFEDISDYDMSDLEEKYNAPNGWGDVEGAMDFLHDIYVACLTETGAEQVWAT